jgi:hypothetical protein
MKNVRNKDHTYRSVGMLISFSDAFPSNELKQIFCILDGLIGILNKTVTFILILATQLYLFDKKYF